MIIIKVAWSSNEREAVSLRWLPITNKKNKKIKIVSEVVVRILSLIMPKHSATCQTAHTKGKPYPRSGTDESGNNCMEEHAEPSYCPICEEVIKEPTDKTPGDKVIFCEGQCEAWFHRKCAGISKKEVSQITCFIVYHVYKLISTMKFPSWNNN